MKIISLLLFATVASFSLVSCDTSMKIDCSSDEEMKKSLAEIKDSLTDDEFKEFQKSMMLVSLDGRNIFELSSSGSNLAEEMKEKLDGLTVDEINEKATSLKNDRDSKQQVQMLNEVGELEKKKIACEEASQKLESFRVVKSKFVWDEGSYSTEPLLEISVKNETPYPISRAYFHGTLATPGRSIPWVSDSFNYEISGGLEPGESASWKLSPNMFGEWSKAPKDRTDMILTVEVTKLDGPNESTIWDAEFSDSDKDRLTSLKELLNK